MTKATEKELSELHAAIAKELTRRVESQEAQAADISAAVKFLKDNNITATATPGSPLAGLSGALAGLPFPDAALPPQ